jgi:hypothetical protein
MGTGRDIIGAGGKRLIGYWARFIRSGRRAKAAIGS